MLLVPDNDAATLSSLMGDEGKAALSTWVNNGGHYIGWQGGTQLASLLGLSTAVLTNPTGQAPGTLFRVDVAPNSPLTQGVGATNWVMYARDSVMRSPNPANVIASYPAADSPDWYASGYQEGMEELGGTATEISEPVGTGDVTVFSITPNFRAWTNGTAKLLYNAIMDSRGVLHAQKKATAQAAPRIGTAPRVQAESKARKAADKIVRPVEVDLAVRVRPSDAATAARILTQHGAKVRVTKADNYVSLVVPGGRNAPQDPMPWVRNLPNELAGAGIQPLAITTP